MAATGNVSPNANGVANKEMTITLDEFNTSKLVSLVKYANKDMLALHGVTSIEKELNRLATEWVADKVAGLYKQLEKQMKERRDKDVSAYFRLLIAKGTDIAVAYKMAYGEEPRK